MQSADELEDTYRLSPLNERFKQVCIVREELSIMGAAVLRCIETVDEFKCHVQPITVFRFSAVMGFEYFRGETTFSRSQNVLKMLKG